MEEIVNAGIDIGGTKISVGLVDESGRVLKNKVIPTERTLPCRRQISSLCDALSALIESCGMTSGDINFIGAGVPGTVSQDGSLVRYCPNLGWENEPVGEYFYESLKRRVLICQDSRNAALAEFLFGAGAGCSNMLCLTVGTGIGCGIILNKKLHFGSFGTAGEAGHTVLYKNGRKCACGKRGCLERYASGTGILERARESELLNGVKIESTEEIFALAGENNAPALELLRECIDDLAVGIANLVNVLSVEAVIISGGLSAHKELFVEPLRQRVLEYGYSGWAEDERFKLCAAQTGKDAPMIGAASLYKGI